MDSISRSAQPCDIQLCNADNSLQPKHSVCRHDQPCNGEDKAAVAKSHDSFDVLLLLSNEDCSMDFCFCDSSDIWPGAPVTVEHVPLATPATALPETGAHAWHQPKLGPEMLELSIDDSRQLQSQPHPRWVVADDEVASRKHKTFAMLPSPHVVNEDLATDVSRFHEMFPAA